MAAAMPTGPEDPGSGHPYPLIRRPVTVGGLQLPNRMVMSPMTTYGLPDPDGASNDRHRAYYERRAASGIGLVRAVVHPSGTCWPHHLAVHDDRFVSGLAHLARTRVAALRGHEITVATGTLPSADCSRCAPWFPVPPRSATVSITSAGR
jgi:hypothetical protein